MQNTFGVKKAQSSKVESYLEVEAKWQITVNFMFSCWSFKIWYVQQGMAESKSASPIKQ